MSLLLCKRCKELETLTAEKRSIQQWDAVGERPVRGGRICRVRCGDPLHEFFRVGEHQRSSLAEIMDSNMPVLTRKLNELICLGEREIAVRLVKVRGGTVRLGIAPPRGCADRATRGVSRCRDGSP
jgi:hypothetical protein